MDFSLLQIADPFQAHGGRSNKSAVVSSNGGPANWLLPSATVAFEPSTFGGESDANRLTVSFRVADDPLAQVQQIDTWFLNYCVQHSMRLFGQDLTFDQIEERYSSPLKCNDRYGYSLRAKYVAQGAQATRFWTPERIRRDAPVMWKGTSLSAMLQIRTVWFVGRNFGLTLTINDAQVEESIQPAYPF